MEHVEFYDKLTRGTGRTYIKFYDKIWIISASGWLFKNKSITLHGNVNVNCACVCVRVCVCVCVSVFKAI